MSGNSAECGNSFAFHQIKRLLWTPLCKVHKAGADEHGRHKGLIKTCDVIERHVTEHPAATFQIQGKPHTHRLLHDAMIVHDPLWIAGGTRRVTNNQWFERVDPALG